MKKIGILSVCATLLLSSLWGMGVQAAGVDKTVPNMTTFEEKEEYDVNPIVIIEAYSIDTDNIIYGNDSNMHLVFRNESKLADATNVLVSYGSSGSTQLVAPTYGNVNNFYIEEIKADSTYEMDLPICILSSKSGYVQMQFSITYTANGVVHSAIASNLTFKISAGGSQSNYSLDYEDDTLNAGNGEFISGQNTSETNSDANVTGQDNTDTQTSGGMDTTTIVMGIAVLVVILALFGLIFGRKKK